MSDDLKQDIKKAVQDAQGSNKPSNDKTGDFPSPKYLQHSLDDGDVITPEQGSRDKKKEY